MVLTSPFFREIVSSINLPACLVDADGEIMAGNALFDIFSGTGTSLRPLRNIREAFTFTSSPVDDFLESISDSGHVRDRFCSLVNLSTGQIVDAMVRGVPLRDADSAMLHSLLIFNAAESYEFAGDQMLADSRIRRFSPQQLRTLLRNQVREIESLRSSFESARTELREEMEMARRIQNSMMPASLPDFVNVRTSSLYVPAGMVGGDFFDILSTPDRRMAVLIFDVSGHGVPAALIGAMARMLFVQGLERYSSPAEVFDEVNRQLCRFIKTDHYLTAFLAIIDPGSNLMTYSRAGHVRPVLVRASGTTQSLGGKGFFIGHQAVADMAVYEEHKIQLATGDKIFMYTDGLIECNNRNNEYYGGDRLITAALRFADLSVDDFLHAIVDDVRDFRQGTSLKDDITALCLEIGDPSAVLLDSGFPAGEQPESCVVKRIEDVAAACGAVLRRMDQNGYSDIEIKRLRVCAFEMLVNGVVHGNHNDHSKRVVLLYQVTREKVAISIIDEGEGFNPAVLPDPLAEENLLKEHGRGIFIVRNYMDEVSFNEKGNRIYAVRRFHAKT